MRPELRATQTCGGRPPRTCSVKPVWRLVMHDRVDGALNMALDRSIQLCRADGSSPPTLRLYSWARPTVTLGRFQDSGGVDRHACAEAGVDVVRRFTGGRGVLHDDELTYSIVADADDGVPRGVTASYRYLCEGLVETYRTLGISAELTRSDRGDSSSSACYLQTTRADVSHGDLKLSGSAQVWCGSTVLQHGSFTRSRDLRREARLFRLTADQQSHLVGNAASLVDLTDVLPDEAALAAAAVRGFEQALGVKLLRGDLTAREAQLAAVIVGDTQVHRDD